MYKIIFIANATMAKFKVGLLYEILNYFRQYMLLCMLIYGGKPWDWYILQLFE
jgi:hypothetical protein